MGDAAYSFSLTTFSRTGKLLPLEYALNAVANGRTTLGIMCGEGVVLATDKKMPSALVDDSNVHKIEPINDQNGICFAGVGPDYRVLGEYEFASCRVFVICSMTHLFRTLFIVINDSQPRPQGRRSLRKSIRRIPKRQGSHQTSRLRHARIHPARWSPSLWRERLDCRFES